MPSILATVMAVVLVVAPCAAGGVDLMWSNSSLSTSFRPGGVFTPRGTYTIVSSYPGMHIVDTATGTAVGGPIRQEASGRLTMVNDTLMTTSGTAVHAYRVGESGSVRTTWTTKYWLHGMSNSWCDLNFPAANGNVFQTYESSNATVVAIDVVSGAVQWKRAFETGPFCCAVATGSVVAFAQTSFVAGMDAHTGALLWRTAVPQKNAMTGLRTLTAKAGRVYVPVINGVLVLSAATGTVLHSLRSTIAKPSAVGVSDGVLLFTASEGITPSIEKFAEDTNRPAAWSYRDAISCTPVEANGKVFTCTASEFVVLDAQSGVAVSRSPLGYALGQWEAAGITVQDGYVLIQSQYGSSVFRV